MKIQFELDESKAIQIIGVFAARCGGMFDYYLAMKAVYALDRAALLQWGQPVIGGDYRMLPYGPVNQSLMDATRVDRQGFFTKCFARQGNEIRLTSDPGTNELSRAEIRLAEQVCDEWRNLSFDSAHSKATSFPECSNSLISEWIAPEQILAATGKTTEEISELAAEIAERHAVSHR